MSEAPPKSDPNCPRCGGKGWRIYNGELYRDGTVVAGQYRCECGWPWEEWHGEQLRAERKSQKPAEEKFYPLQLVIYKGLITARVMDVRKRILIMYTSPAHNPPALVSAWVARNSLQPIEDLNSEQVEEHPAEEHPEADDQSHSACC